VAAIDVNMGCNKHSAVAGGHGAALSADPERARDVVATLARNLPPGVPVTAKVRLQASAAASLELCRRLEAAGAAAVIVHARSAAEGPSVGARWAALAPLVAALAVPVIGNGDVWDADDARDKARPRPGRRRTPEAGVPECAACAAARGL